MPDPLRALPATMGGKRRLARVIFAMARDALPHAGRGTTFVDAFLGGGSISLTAKWMGYRVICNDLALRSVAVGRALIENGAVTLNDADLVALLRAPLGPHAHLAEEQYSPSVFPVAHARLLDRALHNLHAFAEPKRSLALLLVIKWMLRIQPMSMLRGTDARAAFEGDLDRVSPRRLAHYMAADRLLGADAWRLLSAEVNAGVFPGSGIASQGDAVDFLASVSGDVVYLDPPYPRTTSYEREYAVLDNLLEGTVRAPSAYSRSTAALPILFDACAHVPIWIVSLNNSALSREELEALIRAHRPNVKSIEVPYTHLGSIASEEKNARNREFIVIATA